MSNNNFTRNQMDEALDHVKKHGHAIILREDGSKAMEIWIPSNLDIEEDFDDSKLIEKWDEFDRAIEELKKKENKNA